MSKYANAAVDTVRENQFKPSLDMRTEWDKKMAEYFPAQKASREKCCPKNAFLGLCENGWIVGIPSGDYGVKHNSLNKGYAVKAAELVFKGILEKRVLWEKVTNEKKQHNSQMNIVLKMMEEGMLQKGKPVED